MINILTKLATQFYTGDLHVQFISRNDSYFYTEKKVRVFQKTDKK